MNGNNLFAKLDGTPAHWLIVVGLAFALLAPLIVSFQNAGVSKARADFDQAGQLIELEMEKLRKEQDAERKKESQLPTVSVPGGIPGGVVTPAETTSPAQPGLTFEERARREEERRRAMDKKREELEKQYDSNKLKREWLQAQASAAGLRWHMVIGWLGRLMLLVGLLALTLQSEGTRQKIMLIILLVVMFSTLSGLNFDFAALGHMGESPVDLRRAIPTR